MTSKNLNRNPLDLSIGSVNEDTICWILNKIQHDDLCPWDVKKLAEKIDQMSEIKCKLVEALKWYAEDSIDHHNYHSLMGTNLTKKAKEVLKELGEIE